MSGTNLLSSFKRRFFLFIILSFVSVMMLLVSTQSLTGLPERIGITILSFFQRGFSAVGDFFSNTVNSIAELKDLKKNYSDLLVKVETYSNLERGYSELKRENERLNEQLGFLNAVSYEKIAAKIIAKDPENLYSTFMIDKGALDGIRKNFPVIAYENGNEGLVGRVLEVGRNSCIVIPIFDSSSFISSRLERTRYEGLLSGYGTSSNPLQLRYVKKRAKAEIQYGDLVVTAGYQSLYPKDLAIGRVSLVNANDYQATLDISVEPIIEFGRLEYVFVIKSDPGNSENQE